MCAIEVVENPSTLSKLGFPRSRPDGKEGTLVSVFQKEEIKMSDTNDRAREATTAMADDKNIRSKLFTGHPKRFGSVSKALKFILVQHGER